MKSPINLLWTSGADSTFRLLELIFIQQQRVQPYYIIDQARKSLDFEFQAMESIRELIFRKNPDAKKLLLPTIVKNKADINLNPLLSQKYKRLKNLAHLGAQYEWLASFAAESDIFPLELSITASYHKDFFSEFLSPSLIKIKENGFTNYKLMDSPSNHDLLLFKYFRFPIVEKTKIDMWNLAKENNFIDAMNLTWFCHYPLNKKPCGICNPCKIAIEEGQSRRIPITGLVRNFSFYKVKPFINDILGKKVVKE